MKSPSCFGRFGREKSGAVAILFGLALPIVLGATGAAIDFASATRQKAAIQSAADAAALAAARELVISAPTLTRVQQIASQVVAAHFTERGKPADWTVATSIAGDKKAVNVLVGRPIKPVFGILNASFGFTSGEALRPEASATARLAHNSKLCLLTLGDNTTSVYLHQNARMTATECSIHSNSRSRNGIKLELGSVLNSDLICSRGGIDNQGSTVNSDILNDCPPVVDPLRTRAAPPVGACTQPSKVTIESGIVALSPGVYCGGVEIKKFAKVTLNPGIYVFKDGPLIVRDSAELTGSFVGLYFTGNDSYFRFIDNALIELVGPKGGVMVGLLIWRARVDSAADQTGNKPPQLTNTIGSLRTRKLTGTIYLPQGQLYIYAKGAVAQASDYTVILARKMELFDGPNLVLNTNYGGSEVPVPQDLGPIGLKNLKLEN